MVKELLMVDSKKYVFLGGIYPKNLEKVLFEEAHGKLSFAANHHQWNILYGLEKNGAKIDVLNCYFFPTYPKTKVRRIKGFGFSHFSGSNDINIGFRNYRGIRNFDQAKGYYNELRKILESNIKLKIVVFVYTMRYPAMKAVYKLKKEGYDFITCLIVPDVPSILAQYGKRRDLYSIISSSYNLHSIKKYLAYFDSFVLLSAPMVDLLDIKSKPFCIVDGLFDEREICTLEQTNINKKKNTIVYTGSLHREYGICQLLIEFSNIKDDNYELVIAGAGNALGEVKAAAKNDNRIKYVGLLNSEDVEKLQSEATILVNPRPVDGVDAKYSFPSKTIEYLLARKPVVMNRLPGMDIEYEKYLFVPDLYNCKGFADMIVYVCNMDKIELSAKVQEAYEFVVSKKNSTSQMHTVLEMICNLEV